jgi:rRNA maturation endonuclease Nob1
MTQDKEKGIQIGAESSTGYDEWWCPWYECPNCKENVIAYDFHFCPSCGKKLKWISFKTLTMDGNGNYKEIAENL